MSIYFFFLLRELFEVFSGQPEVVWIAGISRHKVQFELRIEKLQNLNRNTYNLAELIKSHNIRHLHSTDIAIQIPRLYGPNIMLAVIVHDIGDGDKSRHIPSGFRRKIRPDSPIVPGPA